MRLELESAPYTNLVSVVEGEMTFPQTRVTTFGVYAFAVRDGSPVLRVPPSAVVSQAHRTMCVGAIVYATLDAVAGDHSAWFAVHAAARLYRLECVNGGVPVSHRNGVNPVRTAIWILATQAAQAYSARLVPHVVSHFWAAMNAADALEKAATKAAACESAACEKAAAWKADILLPLNHVALREIVAAPGHRAHEKAAAKAAAWEGAGK